MNSSISIAERLNKHATAVQRVLVADAWNSCPPLETGLEIAALLGEEGFRTDYVHYGACLPYVECYNQNGNFKDRLLGYPPSPQQRGANILRQYAKAKNLPISVRALTRHRLISLEEIPIQFMDSIESLKKFEFLESNQIGISVASSLVSISRDPNVVPANASTLCAKLASSFKLAYDIVFKLLKSNSIDAMVTFNGRFACCKGAVMAAENLKIPVFYHELGSSKSKFGFFPFSVHDRLAIQKNMLEEWEKIKHLQNSKDIADQFFRERRAGVVQSWHSFTSGQNVMDARKAIETAAQLSASGKIIVFFHSCEDEIASVQDFYSMEGYEWKTQKEAVVNLAVAAKMAGHSVIIRIHPNLQDAPQACKDEWNNLSFASTLNHLVVVPSYSKASSYELLDSANLVASYGSTVGIESIFWGKPSLLLRESLYDSIQSSIQTIQRTQDLNSFIADISSWSVDNHSARPYGYYMNTFGIDHVHYSPDSLLNGFFLGENLRLYKKTKLHMFLDLVRGR